MTALKLRKFGNSVRMLFGKIVRDALGIDVADPVFLAASPEGRQLTPGDPELETQKTVARRSWVSAETR
jgi:hypothetical protein